MLGRLNASLWTGADDTKNRALVEAQRELDGLTWIGKRASSTQALSWPRDWAVNPDDPNGDYYASTVVPQRLKDAQCELAFMFLKAGTTDVAALDATDGIVEKKIDVLTTRYAAPHERPTGLARYPRVLRFIMPLLEGSTITQRLVKG